MAHNARNSLLSRDIEADERLAFALKETGVVVYACDAELRYVGLSQPLAGLEASQVLGKTDADLFPADVAGRLAAFKRSVLEEGRAAAAEFMLPQGASHILYEMRAVPLADHLGKGTGLSVTAIDVTPQQEARLQAEHEARRAAILAHTTHEGLLLHDGERIVEANEAFCRMFGTTRDKAVGRDPYAFVAPEARERAREYAAKRSRGPDELLGVRADGSTFPVEVSVERFDYLGRVFRVSHIRDVTAQKEAEAALRESEERYRALAAATREGVIIHDAFRIVEVNEIFCALHGTTRERAVGRPAFDFIAPDVRGTVAAVIASGSPEPYETIACRDDGTTFPIEAAGRPLFYQGRIMRVATIRDLSERQVAEAALRDSEQRFRGFAEASSDVLWVTDAATGRLEYLSPSFETVWGEARDRVLGDSSRWLELVHPEDRARVIATLAGSLAGQHVEVEYRIVRPDGVVRWVRDTGFPIRGVDGSIRRVAGLARDITRQKEHDTRQRLMLGELNHRVKNTLATVQSIARQTRRFASSPELFQERFEDRLLALSNTHNLLTSENWERASLRALLKQELSPYGKGRVQLQENDDVQLAPQTIVALGMALHELTTNAAKYGALSVPNGRLEVNWDVSGTLFQRLRIEWRERGGPPIEAPPTHHGFGSRLLERGITSELGGKVALDFTPIGLDVTIELPLDPSAVLPP